MKSFKARVAKALRVGSEASEQYLLREITKHAVSHHVSFASVMGLLDQLIRLRKGEGNLADRIEAEQRLWDEIDALVMSWYRLRPSPTPALIQASAVDRVQRRMAELEAQPHTQATTDLLAAIESSLDDLRDTDLVKDPEMVHVLAALMGMPTPDTTAAEVKA